MSKFIAVIHGWHVHSNGFTVHEIEAEDMTQAVKEAAYLKDQRERPFDACAVKVIQISETEFVQKPARLTWLERIKGKTE